MRRPSYYLVTWGADKARIFTRPGAAARFRFRLLLLQGTYSSIEPRYV
jgi:hypothetical protein